MNTEAGTKAAIEMTRWGGGFSEAIGRAYLKADLENARRLIKAFPELFEHYTPTNEEAENA